MELASLSLGSCAAGGLRGGWQSNTGRGAQPARRHQRRNASWGDSSASAEVGACADEKAHRDARPGYVCGTATQRRHACCFA